MKVKELVSRCYDKIIIYTNIDKDMTEFKDIYNGNKNDVPNEINELEVMYFGAKDSGVIEIAV